MLIYLPIVVGIKLLTLVTVSRLRSPWRFMNLRDSVRIMVPFAGVAAALGLWSMGHVRLPFSWARHETLTLPLGVVALDFFLGMAGVVGVRTWTRLFFERTEKRALGKTAANRVPTLLYGAGRAGALVAKEILARPDCGLDLVGFLDDDENLSGMKVEGLPVLGSAAELTRVARCYRVQQVIITIARAQEKAAPRIARLCEAQGLRTKIIPPFHEIVEGKISLSRIREVSIEDLLRRSPARLDVGEVEKLVQNKVVLVTGAGGSIGSELCRVIARLKPTTLVLVEQAENSLFHIHLTLVEALPALHIVPCIADICDDQRMGAIFAEWQPSLVLHAAAHKHVPMMEWNPGEAVKNNVLGTKTIAMLADAWLVERFVMISTDKAVNPTSVMGVSKRVAELLIQSFAQKSSTRFMTVRFGNVLGSAGSVIPIFQRQIACGGPVTVTHPEMKRYFMTIPEACQLVLQAGAMGMGGELFILDMGEPVKIYDLACDLIRLSGFTPHHDIEISYTGLRPGEKLFEELALGEEDVLKTTHPRICVGKVQAPRLPWISDKIDELEELARGPDVPKILAKLKEIVPHYQCSVMLRKDPRTTEPLKGPHAHDTLAFSPAGDEPK
jgi:FlaA1/EpsC-like NDP-sugar epimerase